MPAAWVSWAPAKRSELSRSAGTPSSWELEVESWSTVANGFERDESCSASSSIIEVASGKLWLRRICQDMMELVPVSLASHDEPETSHHCGDCSMTPKSTMYIQLPTPISYIIIEPAGLGLCLFVTFLLTFPQIVVVGLTDVCDFPRAPEQQDGHVPHSRDRQCRDSPNELIACAGL